MLLFKIKPTSIYLLTSYLLTSLTNCGPEHRNFHDSNRKNNQNTYQIFSSPDFEKNHYHLLEQEIEKARDFLEHKHTYLRECDCRQSFIRNLSELSSVRHQLDRLTLKYILEQKIQDNPNLLFFGSGELLNELTIISRLMAAGYSPNIYLHDYAYFDERQDLQIEEFLKKIGEGKDFKHHIKNCHKALDEFKLVLNKISDFSTHLRYCEEFYNLL